MTNDEAIELLTLTLALDPHNQFKSFYINKNFRLAETIYPRDFTRGGVNALRSELRHYEMDACGGAEFQNMTTILVLYHI